MTPPHISLRTATAQAHERLHDLAPFATLASGHLDLNAYRDLLARLYGFHAPVEAAVSRSLGRQAFGLDIAGLGRATLLRADLLALGMPDFDIDGIPQVACPNFATPAAAMGALYVMEGATLGGRQLARGIDGLLDRNTVRGRGFFLAGTDLARPTWRAVRTGLDRCGADPRALLEMIAGADAAFAAFGSWFSASGPGRPKLGHKTENLSQRS